MGRRAIGAALIVFGVAAWVAYGILHYGMGLDISPAPFLAWHLVGVVPGAYLFGGSLIGHAVRKLIRRRSSVA